MLISEKEDGTVEVKTVKSNSKFCESAIRVLYPNRNVIGRKTKSRTRTYVLESIH